MNIFEALFTVKIAIIDNYDSFTFNLVHYLEDIIQGKVDVFYNDKVDINKLDGYHAIVISPGPGLPETAGKTMQVINTYVKTKPILGICLGHQALVAHFGGKLIQSKEMIHGRPSFVTVLQSTPLFSYLYKSIEVARYHSWEADISMFPEDLVISSQTQDGSIMSMQHKALPIFGIQFHPESIMTPFGKQLLANWINAIK